MRTRIVWKRFHAMGTASIPRDGAILWINARLKDPSVSQLSALGRMARLHFHALTPRMESGPNTLSAGRLRLLKDGRINETLVRRCITTEKRHTPGKRTPVLNLSHEPRTALGYNADIPSFLVVADGRQPKYSTGLTLYELASILIELGATESD